MSNCRTIFWILSAILASSIVQGDEFTFDLKRNKEECFFEVVDEGVMCEFEYQVVSGGKLDVDVYVEDPNRKILYKQKRREHDNIKFNTSVSGEYMMCFNNEYSTSAEKSIFILFEAGKKKKMLEKLEETDTEMTFMESTSNEIHNYLENIIVAQRHYRLQESYDRRFSKELNDRVLWWSLLQTFAIIAISISQAMILRKFFNVPSKYKSPVRLAHQEKFYAY